MNKRSNTPRTLDNDADLTVSIDILVRIEPRFSIVLDKHGRPPLRRAEAGLRGLLRIVTDQLISLQAGAAIWRRVEVNLEPFEPLTIARKRETTLMRLGLSRAKARCFRAVARAAVEGKVDFDGLPYLPDEEILATLTALPGIGPWTAEIYLLSAIGRADAWPCGDLALQLGAQDLFALEVRPDQCQMRVLAESWRPHRSVAARLLWSHYRGLKGMSQQIS